MQVKLDAFRALVASKAFAAQAIGTRDGFCLAVGEATLGTDAGTVRTFKNLTTLARFAKNENVSTLSLDLSQMPRPKKRSTKPVGAVPAAVVPSAAAPVSRRTINVGKTPAQRRQIREEAERARPVAEQ